MTLLGRYVLWHFILGKQITTITSISTNQLNIIKFLLFYVLTFYKKKSLAQLWGPQFARGPLRSEGLEGAKTGSECMLTI